MGWDEIYYQGTNSLIADSDGIDVGDELNVYETDSLNDDNDGDGNNDDIEITEGTDPTDPTNYPTTHTPSPSPTGEGDNRISIIVFSLISSMVLIVVKRKKKY